MVVFVDVEVDSVTKIEPSARLLTMRLDVVSLVVVGCGLTRPVIHGLYAIDSGETRVHDVELDAEYYVDDMYLNTVTPSTVATVNGITLRVWARRHDDNYELRVTFDRDGRPGSDTDKRWYSTYILSVKAVDNMIYIDIPMEETIIRMVLTM